MITTYSAGQTLYYYFGDPFIGMQIKQIITDNDSDHNGAYEPELSHDVVFYTYDEAKKGIVNYLNRQKNNILNKIDDMRTGISINIGRKGFNRRDTKKELEIFEQEGTQQILIIEAEIIKWL